MICSLFIFPGPAVKEAVQLPTTTPVNPFGDGIGGGIGNEIEKSLSNFIN